MTKDKKKNARFSMAADTGEDFLLHGKYDTEQLSFYNILLRILAYLMLQMRYADLETRKT